MANKHTSRRRRSGLRLASIDRRPACLLCLDLGDCPACTPDHTLVDELAAQLAAGRYDDDTDPDGWGWAA